ncbi:hypothetical protein ACFL41_02045 [Gemmatimonadota bacterium]
MTVRGLWLVPLLFLTACSSRSDRSQRSGIDGHTFQISEVDGVRTALTSGGPKYADDLFTYEKVMVIDTEQHEDALLYRPVQFLADEAGSMYVFDQGIGSILAYNPSGRYSHSIGRKGFGPGETSYGQVQLLHDGIIQMYGLKERRSTRFSITGEFLDVTTVPNSVGIFSTLGLLVLPDGNQLVLTGGTAQIGGNKLGQAGNPGLQQSGVIILSPDGRTIAEVSTPSIQVDEMIQVEFAGNSYNTPVPIAFGPSPMALYHPSHGIVLSTGAEPVLEVYSTAGRLNRSIRIDQDPEPVTAADRTRARQSYLRNTEQASAQAGKPTVGWLDEIADRYPFADEKAFWSMVEIDAEGYFWLDRSLSPLNQAGDEHQYLVVSPDGEYLGITSRPYSSAGVSVAGGHLYILEEHPETGEMLPTVYRILPAVSGLVYPN